MGLQECYDKRTFERGSAQWHFYEHQPLKPLNTEQLPAIQAATLQRQLRLHHAGVRWVSFSGRKLMGEEKGEGGRAGGLYFYN
jgi:hypothetical protein